MIASVARRYARALLEVSGDPAQVDRDAASLGRLWSALEASHDLRDVLFNPAFDRQQREGVVGGLAIALELGPTVANLARLLVDRGRFDQLGAIARSFQELADERAGRARAMVITAAPLAAELGPELARVLSLAVARNVTVEERVDPALLGGVVAQVGTFLFDGSVRTQLELLRRELKDH